MELSKLQLILMCLDTTASFKNFDSKTELTGEKCKLLNDYIKKLEKLRSDIKDYVVNASTIANTNNERTMIIEILKMIRECE